MPSLSSVQMVVAGDSVYITAMPRQGERRCGVDVQIKGVLGQLTKCLSTAGTRKERLLTVSVSTAALRHAQHAVSMVVPVLKCTLCPWHVSLH